jgi:hypothetical protein
VVRDSGPAQGHTRSYVSDIELFTCQQLYEILAGRIGECDEELATCGEMFTKGPDFWIETGRTPKDGYVDRLNHIDSLAWKCTGVQFDLCLRLRPFASGYLIGYARKQRGHSTRPLQQERV